MGTVSCACLNAVPSPLADVTCSWALPPGSGGAVKGCEGVGERGKTKMQAKV
jgi:hypothetical protein